MSRSHLRRAARFALLAMAMGCGVATGCGVSIEAAPGRCNEGHESSKVTVITQGPPLFTAFQDGCGPWQPLVGTDNRYEFSTKGRYAVAVVCPARFAGYDGYAAVNIIQATAAEAAMLVTDLCSDPGRRAQTATVEVVKEPGQVVHGELGFWIGPSGGEHRASTDIAPGTYDVVYLQYYGTFAQRGRTGRLRIDRDVAIATGTQRLDPRFSDPWSPLEAGKYTFKDPAAADGNPVRFFESALVTARGTYLPLIRVESAPSTSSTLMAPAAALTSGDHYRLACVAGTPEFRWNWTSLRRTEGHLASLTDAHLTLPLPLTSARVWVVDGSRVSASFAPYPGASLYTVDYVMPFDPSLSLLSAADSTSPFGAREDPAKVRALEWRTTTSADWMGEQRSYTVSAPTALDGWRPQWNVPPFNDGAGWTASAVSSNRTFAETLAPSGPTGLERKTASIARHLLKE
jgi:hypothetical protein